MHPFPRTPRQLSLLRPSDLQLPDHLSVGQTASLLRLSWPSTLAGVLLGHIPHRRLGCRIVVPTVELLREFGVPVVPDAPRTQGEEGRR